MKLIRLLLLRSLKERPLRILLSMFGIILGVAGILSMGITNQAAMAAITRLFSDTSGKANLVIVNAGSDATGLDESLIKVVNRQEGVGTAVPSIRVTTVLATDAAPDELSMSMFGAGTGGLMIYGIDPLLDFETREYTMVDGRFLSEETDAEEIVLVNTYAEEQELVLGDWVQIATVYGIEKLKLVGLMDEQGAGRTNNGAFGVVPIETAQKWFDRLYELDQIDIIAAPGYEGSHTIEALQTVLQTRLGDKYSVIYPAAQGRRMMQMLGNYRIGLDFLSGMALFVGAFLIYNAFSMTVVERTREIGMLRTVGFTQRQVAGQILAEAGFLGLIGSLLGIALGILMAQGLSQLMAIILDQDLSSLALPINLVILSGVIGLVVTLIAALIPAWQASRISPLEALRTRGLRKEGWIIRKGWRLGVVLLVVSTILLLWNPFPNDTEFRVGGMAVTGLFFGGTFTLPAIIGSWERATRYLIKRIYGNSGMLGSRNIQRSKIRTTLTVAALMIGVAMMIVVWVMTESFKGDVEDWLAGYMGGDLYVTSSVNLKNDLWRRMMGVEGIAAISPVRYLEVEMIAPDGTEEKVLFSGVNVDAYSQVTSFIFNATGEGSEEDAMNRLAGGNVIFVSSVISEKYGLMPGDQLQLMTKTGPHLFEVGAVVVDFYNQGLVVQGSWDDMWQYFRVRDANAYMVKIDNTATVDGVMDRIDALFGERYHLMLESNQSLKQRAFQLMAQAFSMFDVLAVISMIVAFFGISNTLTMNVMERTQEIGMLRSIGVMRKQVLSMILAEAGVLGLLGGVLGLLFGILLSRIFLLSMATMSGYTLTFVLPMTRVVVGLIIAVAVSHLAAILPARRATRVRILDAIHFE